MKKKLMFLSLGVLGLAASSNAQPGFPNFNTTGVMVQTTPGGAFVQVANNQALPLGTVVMFNNQIFVIRPTPAPNGQTPVAENIVNAFINYNIVVDLNGNLVNNTNGSFGNPGTQANGDAFFGTSIGDFTLVAVPFDFGISAVLGAGAIAAVKTARKRRKQEEIAA